MKADNYSRNICILLIVLIICIAFLIGAASGIVIYEVRDSMNQVHRTNLMIIYEGK